jgi:AraC-like DNA-binding protein
VISLPRIGDHDDRTERSRWPECALPASRSSIRQDWLMGVVDACQVLAGLIAFPDRRELDASLEGLVKAIALPNNAAELLLLRGMLVEVYLQLETNTLTRENPQVSLKRLRASWLQNSSSPGSPAAAFLHAYSVLREWLPDIDSESPEVRAKRLFDIEPESKMSVQELARTLHVHPRTLRRKFKSRFRVSIRSYRLGLRAQRGIELLTNSQLKAREIARLVGCADHSSFSRLITRFCGKRPRDLRRRRTP